VQCVDLANGKACKPGSGTGTALVKRLHELGWTIYVECVHVPQVAEKLLRLGFTKVEPGSPVGAPSFYLLAGANLNLDPS
jgi:hypothetical protein